MNRSCQFFIQIYSDFCLCQNSYKCHTLILTLSLSPCRWRDQGDGHSASRGQPTVGESQSQSQHQVTGHWTTPTLLVQQPSKCQAYHFWRYSTNLIFISELTICVPREQACYFGSRGVHGQLAVDWLLSTSTPQPLLLSSSTSTPSSPLPLTDSNLYPTIPESSYTVPKEYEDECRSTPISSSSSSLSSSSLSSSSSTTGFSSVPSPPVSLNWPKFLISVYITELCFYGHQHNAWLCPNGVIL